MSEFESELWFLAIFIVIFYNLITLIIIEMCRRWVGFQIIFCSFIIPLLPTFIYYDTLSSTFDRIKLVLIMAICLIIIVIRYFENKVNDKRIGLLKWFVSIIFLLSIIGPTIVEISDMVNGKIFYLNGLTALILLLCTNLPFSTTKTIFISIVNGRENLNYQMSILYIVTFTIWNYTFSLNDTCFDRLLLNTTYLMVPLYSLLFNNITLCKQFCLKSDISISEWFILRAYSFLFAIYIDSLPNIVLDVIPFWNLYDCSSKKVNLSITWTVNIISIFFGGCLLLSQIYPLFNPTKPMIIDNISSSFNKNKNMYNIHNAVLVDDVTLDDSQNANDYNDNDTLSTTNTTNSTQNNQQSLQNIMEDKEDDGQENGKKSDETNTMSLLQFIIKRCAIIQYDDKTYYIP